MPREILSITQKALSINLDPTKYGTLVEIGAGQEVARQFFKAGGAAGTIAKTMSAYDMVFSDAIYGKEKSGRYVSKERLQQMLTHEYDLLVERLGNVRPADTTFFVFADTVTTRSYIRRTGEAHGWLGVRYQKQPGGEFNDVIIHVKLLDDDYVMQQELLGVIGVNLLYGIFYIDDQTDFIESLVDNITKGRIEVDMINCVGPANLHIDNRLMALHLVEKGLTKAILFNEKGDVCQPTNILYRKPTLIQRGSFRPITFVNVDMLHCAQGYFDEEAETQGANTLTLMEITLSNLRSDGNIDTQDFLDRVDLLTSLGRSVLISNYNTYYEFAEFISGNTKSMFAIVLGVRDLEIIFDESHYGELHGGILEAFGRLFTGGGRLYIYPIYDEATKQLLTSENLRVAPRLKHLYQYLLDNKLIIDLKNCDISKLHIHSKDVLKMIQQKQTGWEGMVPEKVAQLIHEKKLWQHGKE